MTVVSLDSQRPLLGGSTLPAAAGVDPFCSPIRLWLELTGRIEREKTEPMYWGKRLQPVIFEALREQSFDVHDAGGWELRREATPWLVGHPDGFGWHDDANGRYVVEVKCQRFAADELPAAHEAQVQTYMYLGAYDEAIVAHFAGLRLHVFEARRRQRVIDALLELGERFVHAVRRDECPSPSAHPDDRASLLLLHPSAVAGSRVRETREIRDARRELAALLKAERARKARIEHLRATITAYMGERETLVNRQDQEVATWKQTTTRRLDTAALKRELPDVYERYSTASSARTLRLA